MPSSASDVRTYVEPSDAPMRVFDAIYSLRATRIYHDRPVPHEVLDQILQAGTMACSSGNTQPWEFVVVTDADLKTQIKAQMVEAFATIDADRVQKSEDLRDGAGRPVTGHDAVENIDKVPAIVVVCWNPGCASRESTRRTPTGRCAPRARSRAAAASASSRPVRT
jgi:nitroreductase